MIDAAWTTVLLLCVGLMLRMRRSLTAAESERDSLRSALTLARREAEDAIARCVELTRECDEYRKEEAKRERRREGARLN